MIKVRRGLGAMLAACLVLGFAAAPSHAASKKATVKQLKAVEKRAIQAGKGARSARSAANRAIVDVGAAVKRLTTAEGALGALSITTPQIADSLIALGNIVQRELAPGLVQLSKVVETQIAPVLTQLATTVQITIPNTIKDVASNQEHGVTRVLADTGTLLPLSATSGDIPDDGNAASAAAELPLVSGNGTLGTIAVGAPLRLRSSIRSGENDGAAAGDPAGYVGGTLIMTCGTPTCDLGTAGGSITVPAGTIVCAVGPPPAKPIALPDGTTSNQPVVKIQEKAARTDQAFPATARSAKTVDPLEGITTAAANGPLADDDATGAFCTMGDTGTYLLKVQTQFIDPPTSLTPTLKD